MLCTASGLGSIRVSLTIRAGYSELSIEASLSPTTTVDAERNMLVYTPSTTPVNVGARAALQARSRTPLLHPEKPITVEVYPKNKAV